VGSDVESPVTYAILSGPTHGALGTLNINSGAVTYSPSTNYTGPDTFTFTVSDGSLLATGTVSIVVTPVNDGPFANNQNVTTLKTLPRTWCWWAAMLRARLLTRS
jgi:hypothetical protein